MRLALLAAALAAVAVSAQPAAAADQLPDLVSDPPANSWLDDYRGPNAPANLLLRFDGYVHNAGPGALEVSGGKNMRTLQRVYSDSGALPRDDEMAGATLEYAAVDGHNHWHLNNVARYSLWDAAKVNRVAPAQKVGFCLMDSERIEQSGPSSPYYGDYQNNGPGGTARQFCRQGQPDATDVWEGISAGWRDLYSSTLAWQWVVVSDVQPGVYWMREDIDPDGIVHESDEVNPPAYAATPSTIPGYVARPVSAPAPPAGEQPQTVTLAADSYGSPGALSYRVVTPPAHGTLDVVTGASFAGPAVTYTPAPGWTGADSFSYEAHDAASSYPVHPAVAGVALGARQANSGQPPITRPRVVIAGAPKRLAAARGVQLRVSVAGDKPGVTWTVNGVRGGNRRYGRITRKGFYRAPGRVPTKPLVRIAARSAAGAKDSRLVRIVRPRRARAAPAPPRSRTLTAGVAGHVLVVGFTPARAGVVRIEARAGALTLGRCRGRAAAGRAFTCRFRIAHQRDLSGVHLSARVVSRGQTLGKRAGTPDSLRRTLGLSRAAAAFLGTRL